MKKNNLAEIAKLIRYYILTSTTEAGSGHPSSSLSATDLMAVLMFGGWFRFDADNIQNPNNDRLIFSKGHAAPLLYSLWTAAGKLTEKELLTLRKFDSPLEGHPSMAFPYTEAATGSLGQGLSVGVGMALNAKYLDKLPYKTYVLLGDSEMSEGSVWEAIDLAAFYKLDNLIGLIDVNRLGQTGETKYGHDTRAYAKRVAAFGWDTIEVDGHSIVKISHAFKQAAHAKGKPIMIIAKTIKGKGVSFIENKNGWHGKTLDKDLLNKALFELGPVKKGLTADIAPPAKKSPAKSTPKQIKTEKYKKPTATRYAYGQALIKLHYKYPDLVVLDGETGNSTYAEMFKAVYPDRFFEMFIAEQNMAGVALGLSARGKIPFVSTFAAFLTRAFDQIRMSQYSRANIKFIGSHAGVSIGQDGPSQMGLEDIAMFRSVGDCVVLYPADAIATEKLIEAVAKHKGLVYTRTTRAATPILYGDKDEFKIGGSFTLKKSRADIATVIAAGITLPEALAAYEELKKDGLVIRVIDLYSIKPLDLATLQKAAQETKRIITVEDHRPEGGLGEAVLGALAQTTATVVQLAVAKAPKSGAPAELLAYENIDKDAIIKAVKKIIK